jgi:uncharacterized protein
MFASTMALGWRAATMVAVGLVAGISNGVAGGGSFFAFPAMLAFGVAPLPANFSTTVGVSPSYLGGMWRFRSAITPHRRLLTVLVAPSFAGAALGCALLFSFPAATFRTVVPWLIGAGTALFALSPLITRRLSHVDHSHPARRWFLYVGVFLIAVYGGYFGAGLGILLLAVMAVALPLELSELQGLRSVLSTVINLAAAVIFVVHGHLVVWAVCSLLVGTLVGGWVGTWLIQRLSPRVVRIVLVTVGVVTTVRLA